MPVQDHIHKYRRILQSKAKKYYIYKCVLAGCSHFVPKNLFITGREALCNKCNKKSVVTMDPWWQKTAKPHCGCTSMVKMRRDNALKNEEESNTVDDMLSKIMAEEEI